MCLISLHDIEHSIAHFYLDAHLEPLVVDVETGSDFKGAVETACDQVVDVFVALIVGLLVAFLRSEVEFRVYATDEVGAHIVETLRAVFDVHWELDKSREDGFVVDGVEPHAAVVVGDGDGVGDVSVGEAQRGDEAQVEISAKAFAADDTHGETGHDVAFHVIHADGSRVFAADWSHGPRAGGELEVLVVVNGSDGVHHLVEAQKETEVVRLLLVFRQVG